MARMAREVTCPAEEERILRNIASSRTATYSEVLRAKIIFYCLQGVPLSHIAKALDISLTMVARWRDRFIELSSKGLTDRGAPQNLDKYDSLNLSQGGEQNGKAQKSCTGIQSEGRISSVEWS